MKPTYLQLENKVKFYRVVTAALVVTIVLIGFNNVSATQSARYYEERHSIQKAKADVLQIELKKEKDRVDRALCLPRIAELDKALNGA